MPITAKNIKEAEAYEEELQASLDDGSDPDYQRKATTYNRLSQAIDDYYASQRKVDDTGKLTNEPAARSESVVQGNPKEKNFNFHFEPNTTEVATLLKNRPDLVKLYKLEQWMQPTGAQEMSTTATDAMGNPSAQQTKTGLWIDDIDEDSAPYKRISEHMWRTAAADAKSAGKNIQRYKNVNLKGQPAQFISGGIERALDREVAPIALSVADSYSLGTASPIYDALTQNDEPLGPEDDDLPNIEEPQAYQGVTDPMSGAPMEETPDQGLDYPSSQEVFERSPSLSTAAGLLAYGGPLNPTNLIESGIRKGATELIKKEITGNVAKPLVRAGIAGFSGGLANVAETGARDAARGMQQGRTASEIVDDAYGQLPGSLGFGFGGGFLGDFAAQGAQSYRDNFRRQNSDIRTLYNAGGDTSFMHGTRTPPEVERFVQEGTQPRPPGTPGSLAAEDVAPRIEESLRQQDIANNDRIGKEVEEYFNHPAYRDIKVKGTKLVNALVEMAQRGAFKAPVTGTPGNLNPGFISTINKELGNAPWAEVQHVPREQAAAIVDATGGVIVDPETANKMFGGDEFVPQGYDSVIVPKDFTAREITEMEEKVDRVLKMYMDSEAPADPVYEALNRALKDTRDEFPLWRDEAGNLVPPPDEAVPQPFGPADDTGPPVPSGEMRTYPPPQSIESPDAPSSRPGVGPGQPSLPDTFEVRQSRQPPPETPLEAMTRPLDITGGPQRKPEGLMGVGPGQPDLPSNPFDPRLPTSRESYESLSPNQSVAVQGYNTPPELIPPEALPGPGPRRDRSQFAVDGKRQVDVTGGEYSPPQSIEPEYAEPPPVTPRMPLGKPVGVPEEPRLMSDETPLSVMAGASEPPMSIRDDELMSAQPEEMMSAQPEQVGNVLPPEVEDAISRGALPDEAAQKANWESASPMESASTAGPVDDFTSAARQAEEQINNVESRFGKFTPEDREKSLLSILSRRLGREVTKEDLVKAGLATGAVAAASSDDEDLQNLGSGAMVLMGGLGKDKKKGPSQPEATLDDGRVVKGFSALRRQQSQSKTGLEDAMRRVGVSNEKTLRDRLIEFRETDNKPYDDALEAEAKKLNLSEELWRVPAAAQQVDMERRHALIGGSPAGLVERVFRSAGPRADKLAGVVSGAGRNPYSKGPDDLLGVMARGLIRNPARELGNFSGGRLGARYGNDAQDYILDVLQQQYEEARRKLSSDEEEGPR